MSFFISKIVYCCTTVPASVPPEAAPVSGAWVGAGFSVPPEVPVSGAAGCCVCELSAGGEAGELPASVPAAGVGVAAGVSVPAAALGSAPASGAGVGVTVGTGVGSGVGGT